MKKKIKYIICILIVIFAILIIRSTYSKYKNETKGNVEKNIAQWVIKVNESDVVDGTTFDFDAKYKNVEKTESVKEGAIAPGLSGYFFIAFDTHGTQVSLDQEITIDQTTLRELSKGGNLKITDISQVEYTNITDTDVEYTEVLPKPVVDLDQDLITVASTKLIKNPTDSMDKITGFVVKVSWIDSNDPEDMLDDYRIASSGIDLSLPVHVRVSQHVD